MNGYGCKPIYNTNITSEDPYRPLRPESVEDCLLTYDIVEVVHSGVQCILAVIEALQLFLLFLFQFTKNKIQIKNFFILLAVLWYFGSHFNKLHIPGRRRQM